MAGVLLLSSKQNHLSIEFQQRTAKQAIRHFADELSGLAAGMAGRVEVAVVEELGADAYVYGTLAGLDDAEKLTAQQIVARISSRRPPARGEVVRLGVDAEHIHVFNNTTQERLSS